MYKRAIGVVMLFNYIAMQAADLDMHAKIEGDIIPESTHYRLIPGTKNTVYLDHNSPRIQIVTESQAVFYGYDGEKGRFLGVVKVKNFNQSTIRRLNRLIDSNVSLPTIKRAVIYPCSTRGRVLRFYDQQGDRIDFTILHYTGSRDIKFAERNNIRLIKPHKLLRQLKEVREYVPRSSRVGSGYRKCCVKYENH